MKHKDIGWRGAFQPDMTTKFLCATCSKWLPLSEQGKECSNDEKLKLTVTVTIDK